MVIDSQVGVCRSFVKNEGLGLSLSNESSVNSHLPSIPPSIEFMSPFQVNLLKSDGIAWNGLGQPVQIRRDHCGDFGVASYRLFTP